MLEVLLIVCILGIIAWVIQQMPMPHPFKVAAYAILIIILLIVVFRLLGVSLNLPR